MENQKQRKREKPKLLTSTKDIKKLFAYLTVKQNQAIKELEQEFTFKTWRVLLEFWWTSCQVFNRRRAGEMERAYVANFENFTSIIEHDEELYGTLTQDVKKIAEKYTRFTTRVKRSSNKQGMMVCDDEAMTAECSRGPAGNKKSNCRTIEQ